MGKEYELSPVLPGAGPVRVERWTGLLPQLTSPAQGGPSCHRRLCEEKLNIPTNPNCAAFVKRT